MVTQADHLQTPLYFQPQLQKVKAKIPINKKINIKRDVVSHYVEIKSSGEILLQYYVSSILDAFFLRTHFYKGVFNILYFQ
jgi:hypothetical protein